MPTMPDVPEQPTLDEAVRAVELLHSYFVIVEGTLTTSSRRRLAEFTNRRAMEAWLTPMFGSQESEARRVIRQHIVPAIRARKGARTAELQKLQDTLQRYIEGK